MALSASPTRPTSVRESAPATRWVREAEGLGDVVVAAEAEAADLVVGGVARGQEDDRHAAALGAEPARDLEALHVGQHHVEHDQIGLERRHRDERLGAGARRLDGEALEAQGHRDDVDDVGLVVDDEHAVGGRDTPALSPGCL
jgi:hypothetical protein